MGFWDFLSGTPEEHEQVSTLLPNQRGIQKKLSKAAKGRGAGGAFGESADYYRDLLANDPSAFQNFAAPAMRQFNEEIIPQLSEQFAGMGSGGLSSSSFRNAAVNEGQGLAERLASLREGLRQQGAQGLQGIGTQALGNYSQDRITQQGTEGLLSQAAPIVGAGIGMAVGGPAGAGIGYQAGNAFISGPVGKNSSPYGSGQGMASQGAVGGGGGLFR